MGRGESIGLLNGDTQEDVVIGALPGAPEAKNASGEVFAGQGFRTGATHPAMIHPPIEGLAAGAQGKFQFVAEIPAPLSRQGLFPIETPHGVAVANGDLVRRVENVVGGLPMKGADPAHRLAAQMEGSQPPHIHHGHGIAVGGVGGSMASGVVIATEPGHPLPPGKAGVQLDGAHVLALLEGQFGKGGTTVLDLDFRIGDKALGQALAGTELEGGFTALVPIHQALNFHFLAAGGPAGNEGLIDP